MTAGFYYEKPMNKRQLDYKDQNRSHMPNGDPEKLPFSVSESRYQFIDHHVTKPPLARGDWSKILFVYFFFTAKRVSIWSASHCGKGVCFSNCLSVRRLFFHHLV